GRWADPKLAWPSGWGGLSEPCRWACRLRPDDARDVRHPGPIRLSLPDPPLQRYLRLLLPGRRLRVDRSAVGWVALRCDRRADSIRRRCHRPAAGLFPPLATA